MGNRIMATTGSRISQIDLNSKMFNKIHILRTEQEYGYLETFSVGQKFRYENTINNAPVSEECTVYHAAGRRAVKKLNAVINGQGDLAQLSTHNYTTGEVLDAISKKKFSFRRLNIKTKKPNIFKSGTKLVAKFLHIR